MEGTLITYEDLVVRADTVMPVTVTGIEVAVGLCLGRITSGGLYQDCDTAHASDGSEYFRCVALEDCDATEEDVVIPALFAGEVNEDALTFGGTDDVADHFVEMCDAGVYPREIVSA